MYIEVQIYLKVEEIEDLHSAAENPLPHRRRKPSTTQSGAQPNTSPEPHYFCITVCLLFAQLSIEFWFVIALLLYMYKLISWILIYKWNYIELTRRELLPWFYNRKNIEWIVRKIIHTNTHIIIQWSMCLSHQNLLFSCLKMLSSQSCCLWQQCWYNRPSSSVTHYNENFTQILSPLSLSTTLSPSFTSVCLFFLSLFLG